MVPYRLVGFLMSNSLFQIKLRHPTGCFPEPTLSDLRARWEYVDKLQVREREEGGEGSGALYTGKPGGY